MNFGKPEAVQTDHRKKISSVPQKNCCPRQTAIDEPLSTFFKDADTEFGVFYPKRYQPENIRSST